MKKITFRLANINIADVTEPFDYEYADAKFSTLTEAQAYAKEHELNPLEWCVEQYVEEDGEFLEGSDFEFVCETPDMCSIEEVNAMFMVLQDAEWDLYNICDYYDDFLTINETRRIGEKVAWLLTDKGEEFVRYCDTGISLDKDEIEELLA